MNQGGNIQRATWAITLLAGLATSADAQYYRGGGGRLLERDLGVYNSGGLAGRDLNASFRFARNVAFGRAGGGFSFMGDLGTQDYGDFVGGLGTSDLNDFRNRSQGSSLANRGVRASDTTSYIQSLTAGTNRASGFRGTYETPSSSYSKSFTFDTSPDFTGLGAVGTRGRDRGRNGLITDPLRQEELSSQRSLGLSGGRSPLTRATDSYGSSQLSAGRRPGDLGAESLGGLTGRDRSGRGVGIPGVPSITPSGASLGSQALENSNRLTREAERAARPNNAQSPRIDNTVDTRIPTGAALDRPSGAKPIDLSTSTSSSYDQLLQRLDKFGKPTPDKDVSPDAATQPALPEREDPTLIPERARTKPISPESPAPDGSRITDPDRPEGLSRSIDKLRYRMLSGVDPTAPMPNLTPNKALQNKGLVGGTDWLARKSNTIHQHGVILSSSERALREAARSHRTATDPGLTTQPTATPGAEAPAAERTSTLPDIDVQTLRAIREAGGIVDTFLPAGTDLRDIFAEHIKNGQEQMSRGQYFLADDNFSRAAGIRPNELSAQVASIHAQIGGAVFKTAAVHLRSVLRVRPEAAGARYDAKLLPAKERLDEVIIRLRETAGWTGQPARDAALLLAYLGYQSDDAAMVTEGLDRLDKLSDPAQPDADLRDAVVAQFLRGVWLADPDAPPPQAAPDAKPAGPQVAPPAAPPQAKPPETPAK
ncbi:MAG: hypothetical protein IT435_00660 [Phycisphaerales bacterium]|nr:hypothetical protein [Phycisphaerales bacterium]